MTNKQKEAQCERRDREEWQKKAKELMALDPIERSEEMRRYRTSYAFPKLMEALGEIGED